MKTLEIDRICEISYLQWIQSRMICIILFQLFTLSFLNFKLLSAQHHPMSLFRERLSSEAANTKCEVQNKPSENLLYRFYNAQLKIRKLEEEIKGHHNSYHRFKVGLESRRLPVPLKPAKCSSSLANLHNCPVPSLNDLFTSREKWPSNFCITKTVFQLWPRSFNFDNWCRLSQSNPHLGNCQTFVFDILVDVDISHGNSSNNCKMRNFITWETDFIWASSLRFMSKVFFSSNKSEAWISELHSYQTQ